MRKRKQKTVGIYLWKLVLVVVSVFALVISVECFLFIERTVKNLISGTSEEHTSSIITDSNEEENNDVTETTETATPTESDELNNTTNEPEFEDAGSISVASVSEEVVCTESHTHKSVCYETNISQEDRMVIYNLVDTINSLDTYSYALNRLKNTYTYYYNYYTSTTSTTYYNNYKTYLYNLYEQAVAANTIMTQQVSSTYYNYITNRDQLLELLNLKTLIDTFEVLDTLPLRYDFLTKINGFKNSSDTSGMINYLTEVSNIYMATYPRFTALGIDSSMYQYVINYNHLLELQKISNNLSKITSANNALKDLPKWSDVTTNLNNYKTNNADQYMNYLTELTNKVNSAIPNYTSQNLDTTLTTYVVNYDSYPQLVNIPKILECAKLLKDLPKWSDVTTNLNNYKTNNVDQYMNYLTELTNMINPIIPSYTNQNLASTYNTYVINYDDYTKLINVPKILECAKLLKDLPKWSDVTTKINNYKANNVDQYMNYLTELTNMINPIIPNFTNQNLASTYNTYVINYDSYPQLTNIPKILEYAKITKDVPKYENIKKKMNELILEENVEGYIEYLKPIATTIDEKDRLLTSQGNLSSTYTSYVINYSDFTNLKNLYLSDVVKYSEQIKDLPIFEEVVEKAREFKEKNEVTEYILYIEEWKKNFESISRENINNIYNNIDKQTKLNTEYIINYQKLIDLYYLKLDEVIKVIKDIQELPEVENVNLSDSKVRTQIISTSQLYKSVINENIYFSELIINYEKLAALEKLFDDSDTSLEFSIQHYAYIENLGSSGTTKLNVIDTSGGKMPANGNGTNSSPNTNKLRYIYIDANGNVQYDTKLTELYKTHTYKFNTYFNDLHAKNMLKFTTFYDTLNLNYELKQIWVLIEGRDEKSIEEEDFARYDYNDGLYFSRDMTDPNAIYVPNGTTIRYVYESIPQDSQIKTEFYDYDITNGYIYTGNSYAYNLSTSATYRKNTSVQDSNPTKIYYVNTKQKGINSSSNYHGTGSSKLAFGNANTGTGMDTIKFSSYYLNKYNSGTFQGCTFNLAKSLDVTNGTIQYNTNVNAPYLFNEGAAEGKTPYNDYSLNFIRKGDSYTLTSVNIADTTTKIIKDLEKFTNPHSLYPTIWTNNFWPMDYVTSYGSNTHDLKFGFVTSGSRVLNAKSSYAKYVTSSSSSTALPASDDFENHNSYFGMRCEFKFKVSSEYSGPLEWQFFGDDDLWVFLDDKLIVDIGGIHSAVGEYANLWDYIDSGVEEEHKITFFFTERGASGSTCWMRFSLPVVEEGKEDKSLGTLRIDKKVIGDNPQNTETSTESTETDKTTSKATDGKATAKKNRVATPVVTEDPVETETDKEGDFKFIITLKDENNQELSEYYHCKIHKSNGKVIEDIFKSGGTVSCDKDEYITIEGIPGGTTYDVEEIKNDEFFNQTENATGKIVKNDTVTTTVTNTYNVKTAKVIKEWIDGINPENRPASIQVKLVPKVDGKEMDESDPNFPKASIYARLNEANNWSYTWNKLPKYKLIYDETGKNVIDTKEIEYTVKEVYTDELSANYYEMPSSVNENGDIILTNVLYRNIEVTKIAAQDKELKLGGAEFKLEKLKKVDGEWVVDESFEPRIGITSSEEEDLGKFTFTQLEYGRYRLTEEKAPIGYNPSKKSIDIEIDEKTELIVQKEIKNKLAEPLPFTGGSGINIYETAGCLLVLYVFSNIRRQRAALNRKLKPKRRKKSRKPMR